MPTESGFSFDALVNRLSFALEVRYLPAIYIVFDMLANSQNHLVRFSVCAGKLSNDSSRILFLDPRHSTYRPARGTKLSTMALLKSWADLFRWNSQHSETMCAIQAWHRQFDDPNMATTNARKPGSRRR